MSMRRARIKPLANIVAAQRRTKPIQTTSETAMEEQNSNELIANKNTSDIFNDNINIINEKNKINIKVVKIIEGSEDEEKTEQQIAHTSIHMENENETIRSKVDEPKKKTQEECTMSNFVSKPEISSSTRRQRIKPVANIFAVKRKAKLDNIIDTESGQQQSLILKKVKDNKKSQEQNQSVIQIPTEEKKDVAEENQQESHMLIPIETTLTVDKNIVDNTVNEINNFECLLQQNNSPLSDLTLNSIANKSNTQLVEYRQQNETEKPEQCDNTRSIKPSEQSDFNVKPKNVLSSRRQRIKPMANVCAVNRKPKTEQFKDNVEKQECIKTLTEIPKVPNNTAKKKNEIETTTLLADEVQNNTQSTSIQSHALLFSPLKTKPIVNLMAVSSKPNPEFIEHSTENQEQNLTQSNVPKVPNNEQKLVKDIKSTTLYDDREKIQMDKGANSIPSQSNSMTSRRLKTRPMANIMAIKRRPNFELQNSNNIPHPLCKIDEQFSASDKQNNTTFESNQSINEKGLYKDKSKVDNLQSDCRENIIQEKSVIEQSKNEQIVKSNMQFCDEMENQENLRENSFSETEDNTKVNDEAFKFPSLIDYNRCHNNFSSTLNDDCSLSDHENVIQYDMQKALLGLPLSPTKNQARHRIKPTPIFGQRRNSFIMSSPLPHTCDERQLEPCSPNRLQLSIMNSCQSIPSPAYQYSSSNQSSPHKYVPLIPNGRIRTESTSSVFSETFSNYGGGVIKYAKNEYNVARLNTRRDFEARFTNGVPDKSLIKMADLIYYNPVTNPMDVKPNLAKIKFESTSSLDKIVETKIEPITKEEENSMPAPQLKLNADGELVLDDKSLEIETTAEQEAKKLLAKSSLIYLDEHTGMNGFYKRQKRTKEWSPSETITFYRCLQIVGTDFSLMCQLFPKRTRRDLKIKFKKEERCNEHLINKALLHPRTFNIDELKIQLEMEEQEREETERKWKEIKAKDAKPVHRKHNGRSSAARIIDDGIDIYENENILQSKLGKRNLPKKIKEENANDDDCTLPPLRQQRKRIISQEPVQINKITKRTEAKNVNNIEFIAADTDERNRLEYELNDLLEPADHNTQQLFNESINDFNTSDKFIETDDDIIHIYSENEHIPIVYDANSLPSLNECVHTSLIAKEIKDETSSLESENIPIPMDIVDTILLSQMDNSHNLNENSRRPSIIIANDSILNENVSTNVSVRSEIANSVNSEIEFVSNTKQTDVPQSIDMRKSPIYFDMDISISQNVEDSIVTTNNSPNYHMINADELNKISIENKGTETKIPSDNASELLNAQNEAVPNDIIKDIISKSTIIINDANINGPLNSVILPENDSKNLVEMNNINTSLTVLQTTDNIEIAPYDIEILGIYDNPLHNTFPNAEETKQQNSIDNVYDLEYPFRNICQLPDIMNISNPIKEKTNKRMEQISNNSEVLIIVDKNNSDNHSNQLMPIKDHIINLDHSSNVTFEYLSNTNNSIEQYEQLNCNSNINEPFNFAPNLVLSVPNVVRPTVNVDIEVLQSEKSPVYMPLQSNGYSRASYVDEAQIAKEPVTAPGMDTTTLNSDVPVVIVDSKCSNLEKSSINVSNGNTTNECSTPSNNHNGEMNNITDASTVLRTGPCFDRSRLNVDVPLLIVDTTTSNADIPATNLAKQDMNVLNDVTSSSYVQEPTTIDVQETNIVEVPCMDTSTFNVDISVLNVGNTSDMNKSDINAIRKIENDLGATNINTKDGSEDITAINIDKSPSKIVFAGIVDKSTSTKLSSQISPLDLTNNLQKENEMTENISNMKHNVKNKETKEQVKDYNELERILEDIIKGTLVLVSTTNPDTNKIIHEIYIQDKMSGDLVGSAIELPPDVIETIVNLMNDE